MQEHQTDASARISDFWVAPDLALFDQKTVALVVRRTEAWCERARVMGGGPLFMKQGRNVRYRKRDVVEWLNQFPRISRTSELGTVAHSARA